MLNSALNNFLGLIMQTADAKINISELQSRLLNRPATERTNSSTYLVVGESRGENGEPKVDVLSNELTYEQAQEFVTGVAHGYKVDDIYLTAINSPQSSEMREIQRLIAIGKLALLPTTSEMQYRDFMYVNGENVPRTIAAIFGGDISDPLIEVVTRLFADSSTSISHFNDEFKADVVSTLMLAFHVARNGHTHVVLCGFQLDSIGAYLAQLGEKYRAMIKSNHFFAPYFNLCSEEVIKSNKLEAIATTFIASDDEQVLTRDMPSQTLLIVNTRSPNFADKDYIDNLKAKSENRTTLFI